MAEATVGLPPVKARVPLAAAPLITFGAARGEPAASRGTEVPAEALPGAPGTLPVAEVKSRECPSEAMPRLPELPDDVPERWPMEIPAPPLLPEAEATN